MANKKGCDVSKWQGRVNWQQVKASGQASFVILRAGLGRSGDVVDPTFGTNYAGCQSVGLPVGAYWYSYASDTASAQAEARACLAAIRGKQLEYPVWFDQEYNPATKNMTVQQRTNVVKTFCEALEKAGYYTGLYCSRNWLTNNLDSSQLKAYDLWITSYTKTPGKLPLPYGMWQYSSTCSIPGINGNVDLDIAYKDYPAIIRRAGLNQLK